MRSGDGVLGMLLVSCRGRARYIKVVEGRQAKCFLHDIVASMLTSVHGYGDGVGEWGASRHRHIDWYGMVLLVRPLGYRIDMIWQGYHGHLTYWVHECYEIMIVEGLSRYCYGLVAPRSLVPAQRHRMGKSRGRGGIA